MSALKSVYDMLSGITQIGRGDEETDIEVVDKEANKNNDDNHIPTLRDIPKLTKAVVQGEEDEATSAAKKLYELCDVAHKQNREPMVATGKYDVLNPLAEALLHFHHEEKLHFVCLTLNNLAIPHDNKKVMSMERIHKKLFANLCQVIVAGKKEAYLCLICLTNLSYYEPGQTNIGQFSPKIKGDPNNTSNKTNIFRRTKTPPMENPNSLLRILQDLVAHAARGTADFRWAFALLASLAKHPENALLIGISAIPRVAIENLRLSKVPPQEWKSNSLEDLSLFLLLYLSETSNQGLERAVEVVEPIMVNDSTGVQGLKATMFCAFLEVPWSTFPNYGVIAAGCVAELMGNTLERAGKKHHYENNVFSLKTAVKGYEYLARAAIKADEEAGKEEYYNTKVVALPTAVAMLFQIISEITAHWGEDDNGENGALAVHLDLRAGELSVNALTALLPALLEHEISPRTNTHTEAACNELSQLLLAFSKKATSVPAKAKACDAGAKIWEASKFALPLLEASYDLWKATTRGTSFM